MLTLVTGATGLLGNNVVRALLARGEAVRVLVRESSDSRPLAGLEVERVAGDVRDEAAVRRAVQSVDRVIHSAARVHIGHCDLTEQRAINVQGTLHVAQAARDSGARMVHISTTDTLGAGSRQQAVDEQSPRVGKPECTYVISKREAEHLVRSMTKQGLNAVVVNPGFMLGPWDWKPSSGRMLLEVVRRAPPLAPRGGSSLCDVRDVAEGVLLAAERGTVGENYILAGDNLPFFDQWTMFAQLGGVKPPRFRMGPVISWMGGAFGDWRAWLTGRETDINSAAVALGNHFGFYSSARAETELGYRHRPGREAAAAAWEWFQSHGYAPK